MSREKAAYPRALTHYFDAPEGYLGEFGWICGYSADDKFLRNAIERFTGLSDAMLRSQGAIALALLLDPGNPQISTVEVPGLLHAPFDSARSRPFRLLHAKVALLGFRHERDPQQFCVRLLVSTGNWTRTTLETSIDLAWSCQVFGDRLGRAAAQHCADIRAAATFLAELSSLFDCSLIDPQPQAADSETLERRQRLDAWLAIVAAACDGREPRFFHNRTHSLLQQLPALVKKVAGGTLRNRLMMGSGFFETSTAGPAPAAGALAEIVDQLRAATLLSSSADIRVYLNPECCGVLAQKGAVDKRWKLHPGTWPAEPQRSLHAKFIFCGFHREDSDSCGKGWLYLGSGNLTNPGFLRAAHSSLGNIEAGVVISAQDLSWDQVHERLPVLSEQEIDPARDRLEPGIGEEDLRPDAYLAAPVYAFKAVATAAGLHLLPLPETADGFTLLDAAGQPCPREDSGYFWPNGWPSTVTVKWTRRGDEYRCRLPVVDTEGRICGTELTPLSLDGAWDDLASFPLSPADPGMGGDAADGIPGSKSPALLAAPAAYAVRKHMQLVENIAAAQCSIAEIDWTRWCRRLEQTLVRAASSEMVAQGKRLQLDIFTPLRAAPFRPDYAVAGSEAGLRYDAALDAIALRWNSIHPIPHRLTP